MQSVFDNGGIIGQTMDFASTEQYVLGTQTGTSEPLGLSNSLETVSGQVDAWTQHNIDISSFSKGQVYIVFRYVSGTSYTGDIQLDAINIDGTLYSFESDSDGFTESASTNTTNYGSVTWQAVPTGTSAGHWNRDSGGTPSGSTGRSDAASGSYYVYAETSSGGNPNYTFWLRSPLITLSDTATLSYYEARYGATIGTLDVFIDVVDQGASILYGNYKNSGIWKLSSVINSIEISYIASIVAIGGFNAQASTGSVSATVTSGSGTSPLTVFGFFGQRPANNSTLNSPSFGATEDGYVSQDTQGYDTQRLYYKTYNTSPSNVSISLGDNGAQNCGGFYIEWDSEISNLEVSSVIESASGSYSITLPSEITDGQIAILIENLDNEETGSEFIYSGWTLIGSTFEGANSEGVVQYKVLSQADAGTTLSLNNYASNDEAMCVIFTPNN